MTPKVVQLSPARRARGALRQELDASLQRLIAGYRSDLNDAETCLRSLEPSHPDRPRVDRLLRLLKAMMPSFERAAELRAAGQLEDAFDAVRDAEAISASHAENIKKRRTSKRVSKLANDAKKAGAAELRAEVKSREARIRRDNPGLLQKQIDGRLADEITEHLRKKRNDPKLKKISVRSIERARSENSAKP